MTTSATPPQWAEALLRALLEPSDVESVSGDLLEQYRDSIHPSRGQRRANIWYVTQVCGVVSRGARVWATLFGGAFVARTALDWLVPTVDFHSRSTVSTALGVGILLSAGFWGARRSGKLLAGTVAGVATSAIGAGISILGAAALLAIWHDPWTMAAIRRSGGLSEVFTLPVTMVIPAVVLGTIGGGVGAATKSRTS